MPAHSPTIDMGLVASSIKISLGFLARQTKELYRLGAEKMAQLQGGYDSAYKTAILKQEVCVGPGVGGYYKLAF